MSFLIIHLLFLKYVISLLFSHHICLILCIFALASWVWEMKDCIALPSEIKPVICWILRFLPNFWWIFTGIAVRLTVCFILSAILKIAVLFCKVYGILKVNLTVLPPTPDVLYVFLKMWLIVLYLQNCCLRFKWFYYYGCRTSYKNGILTANKRLNSKFFCPLFYIKYFNRLATFVVR